MPRGDVPKSTERGSLSLSPSQLPEKQAKGRTGRKGRNTAPGTCSGWPGWLLHEENGGWEETSWSHSLLPHPGILLLGPGENWKEEHLRDEGRRGTLGNLAPCFSHLYPAFLDCPSHRPMASRPEKLLVHRSRLGGAPGAPGSRPETRVLS